MSEDSVEIQLVYDPLRRPVVIGTSRNPLLLRQARAVLLEEADRRERDFSVAGGFVAADVATDTQRLRKLLDLAVPVEPPVP